MKTNILHPFVLVTMITGVTNFISLESIAQQPPVADFSCSGYWTGFCSVNFTDLSANNPTSWFWDFGTGITDTVQNPVQVDFICSETTVYNIMMVASNDFGSDTAYASIDFSWTGYECFCYTDTVISVPQVPPIAAYVCDATYGIVAKRCWVNLRDFSMNSPTSWQWDVGSGFFNSYPDITYFYDSTDAAGLYPFGLIASNSFGSDTITGTIYWDPQTDSCTCVNMDTITFVPSITSKPVLRVYPTFARGKVFVEIGNQEIKNSEIGIFNLQGIKISNGNISKIKETKIAIFDLAGLTQGVYIISIKSDELIFYKKIVVY